MRLVLDLTSLCRTQTGMEYYALNLARALLRTDRENDYHLLFRKEVPPEFEDFAGRAAFHVAPFENQVAVEQAWIPYMERKLNPHLVHYPAFPPGVLSTKAKVTTIFDSTLWKSTGRLSWKARTYLAPLANRAIDRSRKVLTISENAKGEIAAAAGVAPEKLAVAHLAPDPVFLGPVSEAAKESLRRKRGLPDRFILSVATLEPRKNLTGLLSAFARLTQKEPQSYLALAGRLAWGKEAILQKVAELKLEKQVKILGYVPKPELPGLYAAAQFLAFPSFYEGFGLPVLEAQAVGTPVLCSDTSSLPEVAGDSALFVDPFFKEDIATGLERLWYDSRLREELIQKGKKNLARFSWAKTADKTRAVYREAFYA